MIFIEATRPRNYYLKIIDYIAYFRLFQFKLTTNENNKDKPTCEMLDVMQSLYNQAIKK